MRYAPGILLLTCLSLFASAQSTRPANRTPHPTTRPGEIRDLNLDQLGNFDFDPDKPVIPPDVAALNGVTVRLHGFIIPFDQQEKPARFILIRKYWEGGVVTDPDAVPKLQETMIVDCPKEKTVDINRFWKKEVVVEGRLSVGPIKDDGEIVCLFGLQLNGCNLTATATATATTRPAAARTPHPAPVPGETLDLTVAQLGNFDLDFEKPAIPADVAALDGCAVRLHGSLIPLDDDAKCTRFALVPLMLRPVADSRSTCNLEVPPAPSQIVIVQCPREKGMSRTFDQAYEEVVVEGKLSVAIVKDEGYVIGIFTVQMDRCKVGATVSGAQTVATTGRSVSPIDFHAVSTTQPATARVPNRPPMPGRVR